MSVRRSLGTFRIHLVLTAAVVVLTFAVVTAVLTFVPIFAHFDNKELGSNAAARSLTTCSSSTSPFGP